MPCKMYIGLATDYRRGFVYIPGGRRNDVDKSKINANVFYFKLRQSAKSQTGTDVAQTMDTGSDRTATSHYSYMQHNIQPSGDIPGFVNFEHARGIDGQSIMLYFHNKKARNCQNQNEILKGFNPMLYGGRIIFAELDTTKFPQISQQYGVFRVPCWVYFDRTGSTNFRRYGVIQLTDLQGIIQQILQRRIVIDSVTWNKTTSLTIR